MNVSSGSFNDGGAIDPKYAMKTISGGKNISPAITLSEVPRESKALVIAIVDRHPMARNWIHWMVTGVPAVTGEIKEGASLASMPEGSIEMINTFGFRGYGGPQPPRGSGLHTYELTVYALSDVSSIELKQYTEKEILDLIKDKILAKDSISGGFENQ